MTQLIPAWVNGKLENVEKLAVHQRGLKHPAISVFLMAGDKTLIQQRAFSKYHTPGLWANSVCTHPHPDEPMGICAARRLGEELGVGGVVLTPSQTIEYRADVGNGLIEHEVVEMFIGRVSEELQLNLNPDEVEATRWIALSDLKNEVEKQPEKFTPWMQIYVREHLDTILKEVA